MNRVLPVDFEINRYGLHGRFVRESDASYILSLRTDPILSKYLHPIENNLEKQIQWIKDYKKRESEGSDYYFIYDVDGECIGVNRIYNINVNDGYCTGGSLICKNMGDFRMSIATVLCERDIMFEYLGMLEEIFDVRKGNKQVQKLHQMLGAERYGETELDYLYRLKKEDYFFRRNEIIELLGI